LCQKKKIMTSEELIARRLRAHGVRRFFGIPGGPSIPYLDAFRREGIEFVLTAHEASAAVMADVTARLSGVTGVCHATYGPGAVNLATGVGGALLDRSPLLALTSELPEEWRGRTAQMNIDHQALFRPLTKATFRLTAGGAGEIITNSLHIANEEYPGPVHLGLPADLAGRDASGAAETRRSASGAAETGRSASGAAETGRSVSGPADSGRTRNDSRHYHTDERIRVLLASSKKPLLAAGLTAMRAGAGPMLLKFLEKNRVPVVVTPMAKGVIPSDHPCFAGVLFHALSDRLKRLTRETDLVIGLGYDPVEYNYESWMPNVPLVHFDTIKSDPGIRGALSSASPPGMWFEELSMLSGSPDMMLLAQQVREEIRYLLHGAAADLNPVTALSLLQDMLPPDTIVTADVGSHLHLLGQMWKVPAAGRLIMTNGWSSMGFALPAAIAAALERPDLPVVCVTGDGGLLMHAGEMMTARRLGLGITVVVLSDGELNLIKIKESWRGMTPYGTRLYENTLFGTDSFLGTDVVHVTDAGAMRSAVNRAINSRSGLIIEAAVDPSVYGELIERS
jgi:acetolactate synthase-1/2/3 large subunit